MGMLLVWRTWNENYWLYTILTQSLLIVHLIKANRVRGDKLITNKINIYIGLLNIGLFIHLVSYQVYRNTNL